MKIPAFFMKTLMFLLLAILFSGFFAAAWNVFPALAAVSWN